MNDLGMRHEYSLVLPWHRRVIGRCQKCERRFESEFGKRDGVPRAFALPSFCCKCYVASITYRPNA